MKTITFILWFMLSAQGISFAGDVHGNITIDGKAAGAGMKVQAKAGKSTYSAETDKYGSYRLFVRERGKCTCTVHYQKQTPSIELYSYDNAVRYNLVIDTHGGTYSIRVK